ncbi:hypothetical protein G5V59_26135 [Nocardioides sp. W3-2-3]|uniref:hypothetical protein n=1 Tax=Nocardioides convexus TaxID=2712224 RepID=UPI0024188CBA|nr:hypothetical protein [Nocardioides convexus]NHA01934.1 hypothetical protein [Nocardioides convexus]
MPEGATPRDTYDMREFERAIIVPDRTRVMCQHLAGLLRTYGALDKTMVFCVTMEHAELVRSEMQALLGSETGRNLYAARIVSEERDAQPLLEQFQARVEHRAGCGHDGRPALDRSQCAVRAQHRLHEGDRICDDLQADHRARKSTR